MDLKKLFVTQKILRDRIKYEGEDRFEKLILALLVELGECANEWRGFKFWKRNPKPRTKVKKEFATGLDGWPSYVITNPLLEEYVDILHFLLEIGLEMKEMFAIEPLINHQNKEESHNITEQFNNIFGSATALHMSYHDDFYDNEDRRGIFEELFESFINLGQMLGFTWEEIEQAYYAKNQINHERQENGY